MYWFYFIGIFKCRLTVDTVLIVFKVIFVHKLSKHRIIKCRLTVDIVLIVFKVIFFHKLSKHGFPF